MIFREVVLRRARNRYQAVVKRLNQNIHAVYSQPGERRNAEKLTLEENAAILGQIKQKSDAANILGKFSAGHREVFEVCGEYLDRTDYELRTIGVGSPRMAALLKGRTAVAECHRFHLLQWAEIEARSFLRGSRSAMPPFLRNLTPMPAQLIDGKALAAKVREEVAGEVEELGEVGLTTVLVGDDPASHVYITGKHKAATAVGVHANDLRLPADTPEDELLQLLADLKKSLRDDDPDVRLHIAAAVWLAGEDGRESVAILKESL